LIKQSWWFPSDRDLAAMSTIGELRSKRIGTGHYQNRPAYDRQISCR
jgi:hypothetical protein